MTVTTYAGWVADGKPAKPAQPIADMVAMFRRHGYAGTGYYPDDRHLRASPPEDHCPYSHTPWPGSQPYPSILALDFMPLVEGDGKSLAPIARQIIADKRAGKAPWIKYLNWTDEQGHVWHTKWQPNEVTDASSDSGHIHISIRTDYVTSTAAAGWDPITGATMTDPNSDFTKQCSGPRTRPNSRDNILGDQGSMRDWWYGIPGQPGADGTNPPPPGSRLDLLMKFVLAGAVQVDEEKLADDIAARLIASNANGLTEADHAAVVEDVKAALRAGTGQ